MTTNRVHCPLGGCDVSTEYEAEMDQHVMEPHPAGATPAGPYGTTVTVPASVEAQPSAAAVREGDRQRAAYAAQATMGSLHNVVSDGVPSRREQHAAYADRHAECCRLDGDAREHDHAEALGMDPTAAMIARETTSLRAEMERQGARPADVDRAVREYAGDLRRHLDATAADRLNSRGGLMAVQVAGVYDAERERAARVDAGRPVPPFVGPAGIIHLDRATASMRDLLDAAGEDEARADGRIGVTFNRLAAEPDVDPEAEAMIAAWWAAGEAERSADRLTYGVIDGELA